MTFSRSDKKSQTQGCSFKFENGWCFENDIASQPDNCAKIIELLLNQLEQFGWGNRDTFGIHMAMEEAIMNAIRHGNRCSPDKQVSVLIQLTDQHFFARITDQGDGFDPTCLPDPTLDENLDKSCGRGVMLIKNFVDCARYSEKGNSIELAKLKSV